MLPGAPGYATLKMLGFVFESSSHKEENFVKQVVELGYVLPIPVSRARLQSTGKNMHFVGIRALCEHLAVHYPEKLLAGHTSVSKDKFHGELLKFWSAFRIYNGGHDVYTRWGHQLHLCIPAKFHMDEGTGQRKTAVQQWSWGPVIFASPSSLDRYMFFASMAAEEYKHAHRGYELGNEILDEVASLLADEARNLYLDGFDIDGIGRVRLVWGALEGDLPAQARAYHLKRNFNCLPNELCPWCLCNDKEVPHTDHSQGAIWRTTVHQCRPWTIPGPFNGIPGADHESFLAKDLFHLCHLGIVRTFAVNILCYLTHLNIFVARIFWSTCSLLFVFLTPLLKLMVNR